jgi:segregation and condensation protein A
MSGLSFKLEAFEGPLDLLLYLISKHKLNIYDIEIALLLDQYMEYINTLDEDDFDTAGDFLTMAARLVYIKTCSLLPQAQEAEELKKELQGNLLEYSVCKEAAQNLRNQCVYGDVFVRPPEKLPINKTFTGNIAPEKLYEAYMGMTAKARSMRPVRAEQFSPIVATRIVTVTSKIVFVLKKLYKTGLCKVSELYDGITDKSAKVATFLAVLELTKSGRIYLNDDNTEIKFNRETRRKHPKSTADSSDNLSESSDIIATESAAEEYETEVNDVYPTENPADECEYENEDVSLQETYFQDDVSPESEVEDVDVSAETDSTDSYATESKTHEVQPCVKFIQSEKYALEHRNDEHKLAVTATSVSLSEKDYSVAETNVSNSENVTHACDITLPTDTIKYFVKANRFSKRYHWGNPEICDNCWTYGRERL